MATRYNGYGRRDSPWQLDGDPMFTRLDMLHDRSMLSSGTLARSENKRLRDGVAATRPGTEEPQDFNADFTDILSGSAIFSNPNGDEMMLIAQENASFIWALQFGKDPLKVDLAAGSTGNKFIVFTQAFDKVILQRRPVGTVPDHTLVWNGVTTDTNGDGTVDSKFEIMTLVAPGLTLVPDEWNARPFENRLIYYNDYFPPLPGRDELIVSDVLNFTAYDQFLGKFRIDSGQSDFITRVMGYFKTSLIIFKKHSIHLLQNFTIDFFQSEQRLLTAKLGSSGNRMPLLDGSRTIFLSEPSGFYHIDEVISDQIAADPVPISRGIQPIIDRINWLRQDLWGVSANLGDYSYFGLCLDQNSGGCDHIAVRNNGTGEFETVDSFQDPNLRIYALHVTFYNGQRRLFGLDYGNSKVYLMYTGLSDNTGGQSWPIKDVIETRGYACGDPSGFKRFERSIIGIRTLQPNATVTAIVDGVNEEKSLGGFVKDATQFYTFAHKSFDVTTDDPNEPKRQDYTLNAENFAAEDFEELPDGDITYLPATPIDPNFGQKQQTLERFGIRMNGRWCSLRIENTGGQCDVLGTAVEGIPIGETFRTIA